MTLSRSSGTSSPRNVGVTPVTHVFGPPNCTLVSVFLSPTSLASGRPRTADVIISYNYRFTLLRNPFHFTYPNRTTFIGSLWKDLADESDSMYSFIKFGYSVCALWLLIKYLVVRTCIYDYS